MGRDETDTRRGMMAPQAVRLSPSPRRRSPGVPPRTLWLLLGALALLFVLGRIILPLAVLLAVGLAVVLWFAPEIAYWLDDEFRLRALPGFGEDHRHIALVSFAYLFCAAVIGNAALGTLG